MSPLLKTEVWEPHREASGHLTNYKGVLKNGKMRPVETIPGMGMRE
jgi:hypothetical protein